MIPKKIHYCWFGGAEMSPFIKKCIETWKEHLSNYELVLWNEEKFDINSIPFVKEAYEAKKWAFVADYVRFYALYNEGGLYLDTDVKILKPFEKKWLEYSFFSAHEVHPDLLVPEQLNSEYLPTSKDGKVDGFSILSAIMAAEKKHPFIKECINQYYEIKFLDQNGNMSDKSEIIIGQILIKAGLKFGYKFNNIEMLLDGNMLVLNSHVLVGNAIDLNNQSYAIHLANGSWVEKKTWDKILYTTRNNYPIVYPIISLINKIRLKTIRVFRTIKNNEKRL